MPRRRPWPQHLPDVFRGADALAEGVLTPSQLRDRTRVVPVVRGVYRPSSVPLTHALKCRGAGLVAPSQARVTGRSMVTALGVPLARPEDPVRMVITGADAPRIAGIDVREVARGPLGSERWHEARLASRVRMGFDLAARAPLEEAVAHLDAAAHHGLLDLGALAAWVTGRHDDDVVAVRAAVALADRRAESPPESVCRVRLLAVGLDVVPQLVVRDADHRFVARLDLGIEQLRIAVEYDGAWHGGGGQVVRDRERLNRLREAGWVVVHVTAAMLATRGALEAAVLAEVTRRVAHRTR